MGILALAYAVSSNVYAEEWLSKKEIHHLLSGHTLQGFYMRPGQSWALTLKVGITITFNKDGSVVKTTDPADPTSGYFTEKGTWFVNKRGILCMLWGVESLKKCGRMRRTAEGGYELVRRKQNIIFEKILPEN